MEKRFDTVIDPFGNVIAGARVRMKNVGGGYQTLYADNGVTPLTTQYALTDSLGLYEFYVADGLYTQEIEADGGSIISIPGVSVVDNTAFPRTVATRDIMAATDHATITSVTLTDNIGGVWVWNPANLSAQITGDPSRLRFVAPSADLTGAAGAWQKVSPTYTDLGSDTGSALLGWKNAGSGAVFRSILARMQQTVFAKDFGAVEDGVTDDTAALVLAMAEVSARGGGAVIITGRPKISATITVPNGVILTGWGGGHETIYPTSDGNRSATIILASSATLLLRNSSGLRNLMIERDGLTFGITAAQVASSFVGNAITLATNTADHILEHLYITGFAQAIISQDTATVGSTVQTNRTRIWRVAIDCLNGIWIHNAYDIPYIDQVHCWPYVTVTSPIEAGNAQLKRSGSAFRFTGKNDWTKVTNSFSFGYNYGCRVDDAHSMTFVSVSHDHPPGAADGSRGFSFNGDAAECRMIGCQTAGKDIGTHVNSTTTGRIAVTIDNLSAWETFTHAVLCERGDVQIVGGSLRNTAGAGNGITTTATSGVTNIVGTDFRGYDIAINNFDAQTVTRDEMCTYTSNTTNIARPYVPTIASAAAISPNGHDEVIVLTGTTNVTTINNPERYTRKRLTFVVPSGLSILGNAVAANASITLTPLGAGWVVA
jgi:hypothetical protein